MHIVGRRTMLALPVERLVGNSHNSHSGHHHHMSRATTMSPDSSASDSSSEHTLSPCSYSTKLQMMMTNNNNVSSSTNSTCTQTNSITSNCSHVISSTTPALDGETREREVELTRGHEHESFPSPTTTPSTSPTPPALTQQAKVKSNSNCGIISSADDEIIKISVKLEEDEDENRKEEYECKQDSYRRNSCCDKNCEEDNKAAVAQAVTLTEGINNQHGQSKQKDRNSDSQSKGIKTPTCMNESSDQHNSIDEHEDDHANGFLLGHHQQHHHHHHHYNGSDSGDEKGGPPSRPPSSISTTSSSCFNINSLITNRPQVHSLRFSIDDILRPDFGKSAIQHQNVPTGNNNAKIGNNGIVSKERGRTIARSASVKSSNSSTSNERPSRPSSVRNHSEDSNSSCKSNNSSRNTEVVDETKVNPKVPQGPLLWPAWVYCTRYSDRPSSGPRSRRIRKAGDPPAIKQVSEQPEEKRPRTAFTAEQLARLKQEFDENRYLTEKRRQDLARDLKLHENQIKIWFQNKRAKLKKSTGQRGGLALQLMAQGLYNHSTVPIDEDEDYLLLPP